MLALSSLAHSSFDLSVSPPSPALPVRQRAFGKIPHDPHTGKSHEAFSVLSLLDLFTASEPAAHSPGLEAPPNSFPTFRTLLHRPLPLYQALQTYPVF